MCKKCIKLNVVDRSSIDLLTIAAIIQGCWLFFYYNTIFCLFDTKIQWTTWICNLYLFILNIIHGNFSVSFSQTWLPVLIFQYAVFLSHTIFLCVSLIFLFAYSQLPLCWMNSTGQRHLRMFSKRTEKMTQHFFGKCLAVLQAWLAITQVTQKQTNTQKMLTAVMLRKKCLILILCVLPLLINSESLIIIRSILIHLLYE